nr:hypothetical protein [Pantoea ananatis]
MTPGLYPDYPTFFFVYNIIEVICISQKFFQALIALVATQRCWSVSVSFPTSSPFTKIGLRASLKLYYGFKQVIFVQRALGFVGAWSMLSAGRLIS